MPFKDTGRGLVVGEPSWGSTGQPYVMGFGDGMKTAIGSIRAYLPNGTTPFEGIGIQPDVSVELASQDYYEQRDRVLEAAMELLR